MMDEKKEMMVLLYSDAFKTIQELSQKEMRLAGLRINPATNIGSRVNYYKSIQVKNLSEKRYYWEAPEVYYTMSPFMHADKMKTPLLLIHGEADNNSGTFPLQSQRYFNALKGLGATVRLVMLPNESHGYRARESILHVIWDRTSGWRPM